MLSSHYEQHHFVTYVLYSVMIILLYSSFQLLNVSNHWRERRLSVNETVRWTHWWLNVLRWPWMSMLKIWRWPPAGCLWSNESDFTHLILPYSFLIGLFLGFYRFILSVYFSRRCSEDSPQLSGKTFPPLSLVLWTAITGWWRSGGNNPCFWS